MGVGEELYSGSAGFGRIMSIIRAIVGTLIGIGFIIGGVMLIRHQKKRTASVTGQVENEANDPITCNYDDHTYDCSNIKASWVVNGKTYNNKSDPFSWSGTQSMSNKTKGASLTIYYDPDDPNNASLSDVPEHLLGWVLLVLGIIMIIGGWIWVLVTRRSKGAAAATGVASAVGMIADAVRS